MTVNYDITEDVPYDLAATVEPTTFTLTDTGYDLTIDNVPFVMNVSNQNPYRRETAQYRKDQFDASAEPGEQSLTGWWLRSQTSWHNGSGINYYEPGTDSAHVSHRFADSRGIDVWTVGQASLLDDIFHSYTGDNGIIAVAGESAGGTNYIVSADSIGALKRLTLNEDAVATVTSYTLASGHVTGGLTPNPFKAITSDGTRYFAVCNLAIHAGNIDGTGSDVVIARHSTGGIHSIKYTKGYLMFGEAENLYHIPITNPLTTTAHSTSGSSFPSGTTFKRHMNPNFAWNVIEGGATVIYAAGFAGSESEIWAVPFDDTTLQPYPEGAIQVAQLPYGEIVKSMQYYLGYLAIGTSKGIRIARVADTGTITLGPLLVETQYAVTAFTASDRFVWASTSVEGDNGNINAILIRIDLSEQFDDGTFAYAYDLQYESDEDSYGIGVLYAQNRLHLITNEGELAGEIQTQNLSLKRASGWIQTGKIRYGMVEPKYFRYINTTVDTGTGDTVHVDVIDQNGNVLSVGDITVGLSNQDILLEPLYGKQEQIAFKFTLNNVQSDTNFPYLYAYQIKSTPATRRQRMYQYPLSCYDIEMDRFGSVFGYRGRAIEVIQRLEAIEQTGRFVTVTDYRTNEIFQGVIEEVRFTNESSPDKNDSGFGGLLLVTVRKM